MLIGNFDGAVSIKKEVGVVYNITKSCCRPASNCGRQSPAKRNDRKRETSRAESSNDFRRASPYFHGRHEFSNNGKS